MASLSEQLAEAKHKLNELTDTGEADALKVDLNRRIGEVAELEKSVQSY